jgi:hypothetical protein
MPRVTTTEYYERYKNLYYLAHRFPQVYTVLSDQEQADISAYYGLSNQMTEADCMVHRHIMDEKEPQLANKTGKLYTRLDQAFKKGITGAHGDMSYFNKKIAPLIHPDHAPGAHKQPTRKPVKRKKLKKIVVRSERRKEPDWDKYVYALLQHAKMIQTQREKDSRPSLQAAIDQSPSYPILRSIQSNTESAQLSFDL